MTKLRGEVRVAMLIALPLVGLAALFVRSQAVAHMDVAAAREAVLAALASLARADAPAPTPTPPVGATVGDPDAKLMDAVATAYITALQKQDYKSAWELVHPDARGKWTLETWRDLRESMRGMPDGGRNGADDTIALLMGRDTTLQEIATRGMVGMAHVTVNVDAPARIALRRTGKGEWAVDLAATDDIEAHRKIAAQLADLRDTGSAQTFARAILMADDRSVPGALVDCALLGGEGVKLEISDRHAEGDHAAMTVRGSGTLHLAVPLANGERGWSIAWCRGVTPFPPGKTVAQLMDEEEGYRERGKSAKGGPPGSMKGAPGGDEMYTCRANMRQISMALLMYTADHDQRFPPANKWHSAALPYCKDEAFFACPTDPAKEPKTSYALNYKLSKLPMTSVMYPNLTIAVFESNLHAYDGYDQKGFPGSSVAVPARHNGGNNYAMVDGSTRWYSSGPPAPKGYPLPPYPDYYRIEKTGQNAFPWLPSPPPGYAYPQTAPYPPGYGYPGGMPGGAPGGMPGYGPSGPPGAPKGGYSPPPPPPPPAMK